MPKSFGGQPIGNRVLVRAFTGEGSSRASHRVLSWCVKSINLLRQNVWSDTCMRNKEVKTHRDWWGGLCLGWNSKSKPRIVVDGMITVLV